MPYPSIETTAVCHGCQGKLFTTQSAIDRRISKIEALKSGDDRKGAPNLIEAWCINEGCPKPHLGIFIGSNYVPGVVLPT